MSAPGLSLAASACRATPMSGTARRSSGSCVLSVAMARSRSRVSARSKASSAFFRLPPRSTADHAASRKACGRSFFGTGGQAIEAHWSNMDRLARNCGRQLSVAAHGNLSVAQGLCWRSNLSRCRPQRLALARAWGGLVSVRVRRGSGTRPVRRQMRTPRTKSRLVREQPGFRRRARREGLDRQLDAEHPADGVDLQDLVR